MTTDPVGSLVMVVGDVHCDVGWVKLLLERASLLEVDTLLSVGDRGIGPFAGDHGVPIEYKVERIAAKNGVRIYVVPGNHENWTRISQLDARCST